MSAAPMPITAPTKVLTNSALAAIRAATGDADGPLGGAARHDLAAAHVPW